MVGVKWLSGFFQFVFGKRSQDYSVVVSDQHPVEKFFKTGVIHVVSFEGNYKWAYLRCPCPRHDLIRLNLSRAKRPQWTVRINEDGVPDVSPSVWQKDGCFSHFWIKNGKVVWTTDSGMLTRKNT